MLQDSRQADVHLEWEIKITQAMIEMGVLEAREHPLGAPLSDLVRKVFIAMSVEASSR